MTKLTLFSAIYLIIAGISLAMGYYAYGMHSKSKMNRLFLALSICMSIWALGFSVVLKAPSEAIAAVWTRISAVGYVLLYSLLLHFTLLRLPELISY